MQLNFAGLVLVGIGVVMLGLGISGNYKTFAATIKAGVTNREPTKPPSEPPTQPTTPAGGFPGQTGPR